MAERTDPNVPTLLSDLWASPCIGQHGKQVFLALAGIGAALLPACKPSLPVFQGIPDVTAATNIPQPPGVC